MFTYIYRSPLHPSAAVFSYSPNTVYFSTGVQNERLLNHVGGKTRFAPADVLSSHQLWPREKLKANVNGESWTLGGEGRNGSYYGWDSLVNTRGGGVK